MHSPLLARALMEARQADNLRWAEVTRRAVIARAEVSAPRPARARRRWSLRARSRADAAGA